MGRKIAGMNSDMMRVGIDAQYNIEAGLLEAE